MGGGAMRAAAKVAGISVGLRGITAEHYPVSCAARKAASFRPAVAATEDVKLVASESEAGVQRPCLEIDDWVLTGGEEEVLVSAAESMPRVVFGGVPTLQEAKEATSELTAALEDAYLSSPNLVGYEGSVVTDHDSSLTLSSSQVVETKARLASEIAYAPALPAPAVMAFRFLRESSVAQDVVASIACDANVWNAVLQNQELQKFLQSQRIPSSDMNLTVEFAADSDLIDQASTEGVGDSSEPAKTESGGGSMNIFGKVKSAVVGMMSSLSDYFQNFFGGKGGNRVFANSDGTAKLGADILMEASFMGLAVMAILVIVLKRA